MNIEIQLTQEQNFTARAVKILDRLLLKYDLSDQDFNDAFDIIKQYEVSNRKKRESQNE